MKEKFFKIQFLIYAIILFAGASVLESYLSGLKSYDIDTDRITRALHVKESRTDSLIAKVRSLVESGDLIKQNSIYVIQNQLGNIEDEGITLFVYENDTLRYWSDNKTPVTTLYSQSSINNRIVRLSNGWYEVRTVVKDKCIYAGLILLKNEYNIQNKYLCKEFTSDFQLSPTFKLSPITISFGFDIQDKEGKYIFSVVPLNEVDHDLVNFTFVGILFLLSLVSLLIFLMQYIGRLTQSKGNSWKISAIIFTTIVLRIATIITKAPPNVYSLDFFDPDYFHGGFFFPSFGDFLINAILMLFGVIALFKLTDYIKLKEKIRSWMSVTQALFFASVAGVGLYFTQKLYFTLESLIADSKILFQLNNVTQLDLFSYTGIGIFALIFASLIYFMVKTTSYADLSSKTKLRNTLLSVAIAGISVAALFYLHIFLSITIIYITAIVIASCLMHYASAEKSIYRYMFMIFLSAVLSSIVITHNANKKLEKHSQEQVMYVADEHDKIAEQLLRNISAELSGDALLADYVAADIKNGNRVQEYLKRWHFNGYWNKYNLSVKIYEAAPGVPFIEMQNENAETIARHGSDVSGTDFYFVDNPDGGISYIGQPRVMVNGTPYYICIRLDNKPVPQDLGYPELLMDKKIASSPIENSNYAKYRNGKKTKQNGTFSYDLNDNIFAEQLQESNDSIATFTFNQYVHTIYKNKSDIVVISRKNTGVTDYVVSFSYLFGFYTLIALAFLLVKALLENRMAEYKEQLKTRIVSWMFVILVGAFVITCLAMAYFTKQRYRQSSSEDIQEKMKSVYMHIEQDFGDSSSFVSKWNPELNNSLDEYLTQTAHVFFIDVNIYGPDGELDGSSRPEIFKQGLLSTQINSNALNSLVLDSKANYIQEETIGKMSYTSAYIPFYNSKDKLMGYINLPYFSKPDVMKNEMSTIMVSLINLFVVLGLLCIFIAVIISEKIVSPIRMIQKKMEKVELGKKHEKIDYRHKDEIGQLVSEYNNMVEKLEESAALLAKSERESAWREMAKQIAHEIKNPLTPMKLSIQFLMRSHQNHDADFDDKLEKVSNTLIQQIDTLSSIATGFSNFAKMPKPDESPFNVVETLSNVVQLFTNTENMEITSDLGGHSNITIVADKEQISRVFVNLIKNATQAIPDGINGKIHVSLEVKDGKVTVKIKDNGCGIPEEIKGKLFTPSFTTKSSGSGLGLAMCKNIIINAKGDITFESEVGKGTTFIVTLPVKK
ncbi:MAG: GHKL domain-containing protein [Bacteroidales bacterium]|nr:GHKL domain-containing protein [Bacteroidales bacterium]